MPDAPTTTQVQERVAYLFTRGLPCSQCLLQALHDLYGVPDQSVVQASVALGRGFGGSEMPCGALLAGMLALGSRVAGSAGEGSESERGRPYAEWLDAFQPPPSSRSALLSRELYHWFAERATTLFGGITCRNIAGVDWGEGGLGAMAPQYDTARCLALLQETASEIAELLAAAPPAAPEPPKREG